MVLHNIIIIIYTCTCRNGEFCRVVIIDFDTLGSDQLLYSYSSTMQQSTAHRPVSTFPPPPPPHIGCIDTECLAQLNCVSLYSANGAQDTAEMKEKKDRYAPGSDGVGKKQHNMDYSQSVKDGG